VPELWFYHLEQIGVEDALPALLERCLQHGWRALVRTTLSERAESLDAHLWTYREDSFLPHGLAHDAAKAARQPILITLDAANANKAQAVVLIDGAEEPDTTGVARVMLVFDGRVDSELQRARARWKTAKDAGRTLAYWKQNSDGRWEKAA
jgi:DNA polymerase III subunit chi